MTTTNDKLRSLFLSALMVMSVFAGATAFAGTAAAEHGDDGKVLEGSAGDGGETIVYQGQQAIADDYAANEEDISLYDEDGTFIDSYDADSDGHVSIPTEDRSGIYYLGGKGADDGLGNADYQFQVVEQTFSVSPENISATTESESITIDIGDSNRNSFSINVTADDDDVIAEDFGGEGDIPEDANGDDPGYVVAVEEEQEDVQIPLSADLSTGNYSVDVGVNDATASETVNLEVGEPGSASADFTSTLVNTQRGDVAEVEVEWQNTDTANVTIGSSGVNFVADVHVEDTEDEGTENATLLINTALTPQDEDFITVDDGADIVTDEEHSEDVNYRAGESLDNPLTSGDYDLSVSVKDSESSDWEESNVASLAINQRSTDGLSAWTAPRNELSSSDDVSDLTDVVSDRNTVAQGDWQVIEVEASGIYGVLDEQSDLAGNDGGISLTFEEENPGANAQPESFDAAQSDNVMFLPDAENDTFFVAVDTANVETDQSDGGITGEWEANFTLNDNFPVVSEEESATTTFTVEDGEAEINGGEDIVVPDGEINISGTTNLAPGTELTVQSKAGGTFLKSNAATVDENGEFSTEFDFSGEPNGTEFVVSLRSTGGVDVDYDNIDGVVDENYEPDDGEDEETTTEPDETETTTTEETETTTTEEMDDTTTTTTPDDEDGDDGGDGGIPGFGISVALVALLAAALLALRRSN